MVRLRSVMKVLSLDAMGTIIRLKESPAKVYARFAYTKFGIAMDQRILKSEFKDAFCDMEMREPCYSYNSEGPEDWWRNVVKLTLQKYSDKLSNEMVDKLAQALFVYYSSSEAWLPTENLNEEINHFRNKCDAKIAIVSNFDSRLRAILKSINFPHVDGWFLSGEIGVEKPNPEIFRRMAAHFNIEDYEQIVHIGDNVERDYMAPKAIGIQSFIYASNVNLIEHSIPEENIITSISNFLKTFECSVLM